MRKIRALIMVAATMAGTVVAATPAYALSCWGPGCDNGDPVVYGCAYDSLGDGDAQTKYSIALPWGGTLWNEWSAGCAANWAKVTGTLSGTVIWAQDTAGHATAYWTIQPGYNYGWSNMWDGSNNQVVSVCAYLPDSGRGSTCTSR